MCMHMCIYVLTHIPVFMCVYIYLYLCVYMYKLLESKLQTDCDLKLSNLILKLRYSSIYPCHYHAEGI